MSFEDSNYASDFRVRAGECRTFKSINANRMLGTITVYGEDNEGDFEEDREVPIKFDVCPTCDGKGSHVNPSIDCNGLTQEDFAEDPDFAEEYIAGRYDVPCYGCNGQRVVAVIDEDRCAPETLKLVRDKQQADAEYAAERRSEARFGY
jgi:hypothetical protein